MRNEVNDTELEYQSVDDPFSARVDEDLLTSKIVILVPAHNEEDGIYATVRSLFESTYKPHRVVVMSDNSTDRTVDLARKAGAEVHETVDNTSRKSGAVNQGMDLIIPLLQDTDIVMTMDADGELAPDCIEIAVSIFATRPEVGGVSGSVNSRSQANWLETAQAIEYERGRRNMARSRGKVHVLSGAAAFFRVSVLKHVASERGKRLPGVRGKYMLDSSITEDYELTLAIKDLGYKCISSKYLRAITDLMPTLAMLEGQRMRWIRGTLETLWLYGWKPYTKVTWLSIGFNLFGFLLTPLTTLALVFGYLAFGSLPDWRFALLIPFFMLEGVLVAKRLGDKRAYFLALTFFPLWVYDNIQFIYYWRALVNCILKTERKW